MTKQERNQMDSWMARRTTAQDRLNAKRRTQDPKHGDGPSTWKTKMALRKTDQPGGGPTIDGPSTEAMAARIRRLRDKIQPKGDPARAGEMAVARDNAGETGYIVEVAIRIEAAKNHADAERQAHAFLSETGMAIRDFRVVRASREVDYKARQEDVEYDREESSRPARWIFLPAGRKIHLG